MGQTNRKFQFRGLDTRNNKLTRQEGTASDCRNVYLNSNRDLVKRPDFSGLNLPRAAATDQAINEPTGDFNTRLPYDAQIMDVIQYKGHLFIPVQISEGVGGDGIEVFANKFYRYYEATSTLEMIPISFITKLDINQGRISRRPNSIKGRVSAIIQENVLYFTGDNADGGYGAGTIGDDINALNNNLGYVHTYDGKVVGKAGTFNVIPDTVTEGETLFGSNEEYARILPFKIDGQNRTVFGNYSTHKTIISGSGPTKQVLQINQANVLSDADSRYNCHFRYQGGNFSINEGDIVFGDVYRVNNDGPDSLMIGQILYNVIKSVTNNGTEYSESYELYRCKVTDSDLPPAGPDNGFSTGITLDEFEIYDEIDGGFTPVSNMPMVNDSFLCSTLYAVYGSDELTFGYRFRSLVTWAYNRDPSSGFDFVSEWVTAKTGTATAVTYSQPLLELGEEFEDFYDEETVKLPPPRARHVIDYLGSLLIVDHKNLYFSDLSVGGSIETFTPFDNFPVGSTKRGEITGVFANETFIAVFREEEAYYVTGNIFTANYRIQSYQSTRIGCTDPRSIIDFRGAGVFLSKRGFYVCQQGGAMPELSDAIETIFTDGALGLDLDLSKSKGVVDFGREYVYFHVASNTDTSGYIFAFSYYHQEWFLWENIPAGGGFSLIDNTLYYSDGNDIYKENGANTASDAYYRSNFETLGEPSFEKKFHKILMYTIDMPNTARIAIKTFKDWITSKSITKESKSVKKGESDLTVRLDPDRSKSLAFQIESASGQALRLNGYEYEFDADVRNSRDDD